MRTFILDSLASTSKKLDLLRLRDFGMDVVCASITNAVFYSGNKRDDVLMYVVLNKGQDAPKMLIVDSNYIKALGIDEVSIAKNIKDVLNGRKVEGISIKNRSFESLLRELPKDELFLLDKRGVNINTLKNLKNPIFIFGDAGGLPKKTAKFIVRMGAKKINIGPKMLFSSQCVAIVNNELDKLGI